jgi:hypothetical protein
LTPCLLEGIVQQYPELETPEDIRTKTEELKKQILLDKETLLVKELDRIDGEIASESVKRRTKRT